MLKRDTQPFYPSSSSRNFLEVSRHGSIDLLLKDLKFFSRRIRLALNAFEDEHKILERLYYKGKNQHRLSLFWRRVTETRRLCQRLSERHIDRDVEMLRSSFFGATNPPSNSKAVKGSWTHFPDVSSVAVVSQRLSSSSALVLKMQEKLLAAYGSFTLAMQSGAFLQLILALVAIASRIRVACQELHNNLQSILGIARHINDLVAGPATILGLPAVMEVPQDDDPFGKSMSQVFEPADSQETIHTKQDAPTRTTVKRKITETSLSTDMPENLKDRNRKKKKHKAKDEIDDIFGF